MINYWLHKFKTLFKILVQKFFLNEPYRILRVLKKYNLDINLYTIPLILIYNVRSLKKLYRLKKIGKSPKVIFFSIESDGRFTRIYKLSFNNDDLVFFQIPIHAFVIEKLFFESYHKKGCGFYEDARQKYIDDSNLENRMNYRNHMSKFLTSIEKILFSKIDLFLSGSGNDVYVVELITAFQERGGSWIVCEREGTGTNITYKLEAECFKQSLSVQAHYIFCANEKHKEMFEAAKLPTVKKIKVVGELDTDLWFHQNYQFNRKQYKVWNTYRKKVLFLTFGLRNYIEPYIFPQYPNMNWQQLLSETEDEIFNLAKNHKDILVFYKMGHKEDNNEKFINKCKMEGLINIVPLTRAFPCEELIIYSDLIIGFQTTAMFEAMFSNKPIFHLNWGIPKELNPDEHLLPISKYGACTVINSKEQLRDSLNLWSEGVSLIAEVTNECKNARKKTREIMFWNADGRVAERAMKEVKDILTVRT